MIYTNRFDHNFMIYTNTCLYLRIRTFRNVLSVSSGTLKTLEGSLKIKFLKMNFNIELKAEVEVQKVKMLFLKKVKRIK